MEETLIEAKWKAKRAKPESIGCRPHARNKPMQRDVVRPTVESTIQFRRFNSCRVQTLEPTRIVQCAYMMEGEERTHMAESIQSSMVGTLMAAAPAPATIMAPISTTRFLRVHCTFCSCADCHQKAYLRWVRCYAR